MSHRPPHLVQDFQVPNHRERPAPSHLNTAEWGALATAMKQATTRWALVIATVAALSPLAQAQTDLQDPSQSNASGTATDDSQAGGVVRLRQPNGSQNEQAAGRDNAGYETPNSSYPRLPPYRPGEFELFVRKLVDQTVGADNQQSRNGQPQLAEPPIRRFGASLVTGPLRSNASDQLPQVPNDYLASAGDVLRVNLWGSVDADLRLTVDRAGRISIPRVGTVLVAGVRYADLPDVISQRVATVFRNFHVSVSLAQLRDIRVYVTGFTARPGAYTVSSLSTIVDAVMRAGGPTSAGSFRSIELRRSGKLISTFDLYALLLKGDKSADRVLQPEDVIHIGAVGPQVALIGSVNNPAIFEIKRGETIDDVLQMGGGLGTVADRSRLAVERLDDRDNVRIATLALPQSLGNAPSDGDVLRAFSAVSSALPIDKQSKRIRVEGEVANPGEVILPARSTIADAIRAAGGLAPDAFVFGTEFDRVSVQKTQQENYDRALSDLETTFTKSNATQQVTTADDAAAQAAKAAATSRLIERLRAARPSGRIVLQLKPDATTLPELGLEDGDRIYVPPVPTTVGVFGSVFNGGSFLYSAGGEVNDFLALAGGPTAGADTSSLFVIRANGSVVSSLQRGNWFFSGNNLKGVPALPGDTVFVPEELDKSTFIQKAKDWTQILYQFGIGAAAFKTLQ